MSELDPKEIQPVVIETERVRKRNRVVGLSLAFFVIALGVISYFRIKGLAP